MISAKTKLHEDLRGQLLKQGESEKSIHKWLVLS